MPTSRARSALLSRLPNARHTREKSARSRAGFDVGERADVAFQVRGHIGVVEGSGVDFPSRKPRAQSPLLVQRPIADLPHERVFSGAAAETEVLAVRVRRVRALAFANEALVVVNRRQIGVGGFIAQH